MMTIENLFLQIRANIGDKIAKTYLIDAIKKEQQLELKIEALSMTLQIEFSRIQGSMLHQLTTKKIGNDIRNIITDSLEECIQIYTKEEFYKDYLGQLLLEFSENLSAKAIHAYLSIKDMNLIYDYHRIVSVIHDLDYHDVINLLKVLIISTIVRRSQRRSMIRCN